MPSFLTLFQALATENGNYSLLPEEGPAAQWPELSMQKGELGGSDDGGSRTRGGVAPTVVDGIQFGGVDLAGEGVK